MLVNSFSVENYRSVKKAKNLPIYNLSILVGPNNEGKSNILRALVLALGFITSEFVRFRKNLRDPNKLFFRYSGEYSWKRDFPVELQEVKPNGISKFQVEFLLDGKEKKYLMQTIRQKFKGNLGIEISLGSEKGEFKAYDSLDDTKKIDNYKVLSFLSRRISVQYISAIRTFQTTRKVVDNMISSELSILPKQKRYKQLLDRINKMEEPVLKKLSNSLTRSVSGFLPDIKSIEVNTQERIRNILRSPCKITVDDGTKTDLDLKGDGVKSLLAISIIQHVTQQKALNKNIILAIEEPESHLHPNAIHRFRKVLEDISKNNQVIITTHSPLLINRTAVKKNLLVDRSRARETKNIEEVRNLLGVHISDNLLSANLVILTEGRQDILILETWIRSLSKKIGRALNEGIIIFDHLNGATNLSYKISQWKSLLCDLFIFLDNDMAGNKAYKLAEEKGLVSDKEVFFANVKGLSESELEDLVKTETYKAKVYSEFRVKLQGRVFRNNKKKWSGRIEDTFRHEGKGWSDKIKERIKDIVAEETSKAKINSLKKTCKSCILALVREIEKYIALKNQ